MTSVLPQGTRFETALLGGGGKDGTPSSRPIGRPQAYYVRSMHGVIIRTPCGSDNYFCVAAAAAAAVAALLSVCLNYDVELIGHIEPCMTEM